MLIPPRTPTPRHGTASASQGESEKPKTGYSPLAYAADIAAVINGLDLAPCHLVGHSLGGLTGLLCAALFPDTVEKLVIIDIGPDAGSDEALDAIVEYIQSMPTGFSSLDEAAEQIFMHVDSFFPGYNRDSARNRARYGLRQDSDERWVWKYDTDGMIQTLRELHRDWWEYLPRIQCPSLIVRGEWSMSFAPETAERMVQVIPQGRSVEIEDAGHLIPHEAPQTLAAELRTFFKKA